MQRIWPIVALLLAASPALAQQQQAAAPQSPMEQALSQRLSVEIGASLQAAATVIDLQRQLALAQARVKELEAAGKKDAASGQ